jgi:tetratricopeptide (TPR) repeat protein
LVQSTSAAIWTCDFRFGKTPCKIESKLPAELQSFCVGGRVVSAQHRIRRQQLLRQAEGYLELGMPQHALDVLDRWGPAEMPSVRAAYLRGEALRELGRWSDAIAALNMAAEGMPEEVPVYIAQGWCYKRLGRIDLAIAALEKGLEADPSSAILHYNLACYWSLGGNKRQALMFLSRAISMDQEFRNLVGTESDFDTIRNDPAFRALTSVIA